MEGFIATNHFYLRAWKSHLVRKSFKTGFYDQGNWHPIGVVALGIPKGNTGLIYASASICSPKDQFTKKLGRHIAYQRLLDAKAMYKNSLDSPAVLDLKSILDSYGEYGCWNAFDKYKIIHPKTRDILDIQAERLTKGALNGSKKDLKK